ncbi:MAG: lycopene cyclase domain-containing protein [Myxococcaceae bacterium]
MTPPVESHTDYLRHLLLWGLPMLASQGIGVAFIFRGRVRALFRAILPPVLIVTAWLVFADHWAISDGIWKFGPGKTLGWGILAVPIEEVLFFLITNLLVAQGLALFSYRSLLRR